MLNTDVTFVIQHVFSMCMCMNHGWKFFSTFILQPEIADIQRELKELGFKEEVLKKEKKLLIKFANHISKIHSLKVLS